MRALLSFALLAMTTALTGCATTASPVRLPATDMPALVETDPVGTAQADAADDPAIWRNPANPAASWIVGTDKRAGIHVYGLDGRARGFVQLGEINNVDLRDGVRMAARDVILVGASNRNSLTQPHVVLLALDGETGQLMPQKSTYFYPKVVCGMVFASIDDNENNSPFDLGFRLPPAPTPLT